MPTIVQRCDDKTLARRISLHARHVALFSAPIAKDIRTTSRFDALVARQATISTTFSCGSFSNNVHKQGMPWCQGVWEDNFWKDAPCDWQTAEIQSPGFPLQYLRRQHPWQFSGLSALGSMMSMSEKGLRMVSGSYMRKLSIGLWTWWSGGYSWWIWKHRQNHGERKSGHRQSLHTHGKRSLP